MAQTPEAAGPPDIPLAGASAARRLVREIVADPERIRRLDVVGPGGHGKSVLLDVLTRVHEGTGATVLRAVPAPDQDLDGAVVLIDDAHLLSDDDLTRLAALPDEVTLVVAHRPWPRSAALTALGARLAAQRPPLVLEPLDLGGVAARATRLLPDRPRRDLVEHVHAQTGGVPGLVDRLLAALVALAPANDPTAVPLPARAPAGLVAQVGYGIATLDPGVRDLLLARAVGAPADGEVLGALLGATGAAAAADGWAAGGAAPGAGPTGWGGGGFGATATPGAGPPGWAAGGSAPGTGPTGWATAGFGTTATPGTGSTGSAGAAPGAGGGWGGDGWGGGPAGVDDLAEAARAAGLLAADGATIPLVSAAVLAGAPPARTLELRRGLAEIQLRRGGDVVAAARGLLGTGTTGPRLAELFVAAGDSVAGGGTAPGDADAFYTAAVTAGAPPLPLAARRAESALLAGRVDDALARADEVLAAAPQVGAEDLARAGRVAGAALARRGLHARSAEIYRWLGSLAGTASAAADAVLAVPLLVGVGELDAAREALRPPAPAPGAPPRPPMLSSGAEELMARGVLDAVAGTPSTALSQLTRAAALLNPARRAALLPDTPAALAALVALQSGEVEVARSVLDAAADDGPAGTRHQLLRAWFAVQRGVAGREVLDAIDGPLEPRDELLAAALEVALARRASDLAGLHAVWGRAREAVIRHPVDLWSLPALGELLVGAARLREQAWMRPHRDEAWAILGRLGSPALWTVPMHWACLHAAAAAGDAATAGEHAAELAELAESSRYSAAVDAAAREWMRVLGGGVDAAAVDAAARGLHAVGLTWEGGRLAGQAALRTTDRKDMAALLGTARALQGPAAVPAPPADRPAAPARRAGPAPLDDAPGRLSEREREVAMLVLQGMTYKEIGEQLFISAKTVEHHVARMRQRLGSGSRGELFAQLRQLVGKSS